ncbi:MAG TPA: glycosyltransferase family 2 protein [Thermodesulfobacteriota bacterium]|nr:glycosyltransferase family 2 protein [Thermodesulfobacteriota bacterium]
MTEQESPLISAVVLNWNGCHVLDNCLRSLYNQTYRPLEIIVVDNASTDGSVDFLREKFHSVHLIRNDKNLGFGAGNNIGIRASQGRYIMMLNNDTRLDPNCVEELKRSIEKDERFGACASKILLESRPDIIDGVGIVVCPDGLSFGRGRLQKRERYDEEEEIFFASDGACLYRREMLDDIGLYDEDFFAYADETDMGWRAQLAGWKCIYSPKAIVYHHHSTSSGGRVSFFKAFLVERNRIWVALKNFPVSLILLGQFYTLWRYAFQAYGALMGKGTAGRFTSDFSKAELVKILVRAYFSAARKFPLMLRKRRMIQQKKRIANRKVYRLIREFGISAREIALSE